MVVDGFLFGLGFIGSIVLVAGIGYLIFSIRFGRKEP